MIQVMRNLFIFTCCLTQLFGSNEGVLLTANIGSHLHPALVINLKKNFNFESLLETGTLWGGTAKSVSHLFKEVHTIELSPELVRQASKTLSGCKNVFCYEGDSSKSLSFIIPRINGTILYWLDAHYSGGSTVESEVGDPIMYELKQITESGCLDGVILIDDIRGHAINYISRYMKEQDPDYESYVLGDVMLIYNTRYHSPNISSLVKACTKSRMSSRFNEVAAAEIEIMESKNSVEKAKLVALSHRYTGFYLFWEGLVDLSNRRYKKAINCLASKDLRLPNFKWRKNAYLLKSYHLNRDYTKAGESFELLKPYLDEYGDVISKIVGDDIFSCYE